MIEPDEMEDRIEDLMRRQLTAYVCDRFHWGRAAFDEAASKCESPIETMLLAALAFIRPECLRGRYAGPLDHPDMEARLYPQYQIGPYRADFAYVVHPAGCEPIRLAIECDGREFHSTPEQITADKKRDADLLALGFTTMRFMGWEINANATECAKRVADWVDGIYAQRIHTKGA